MSKVRIYLGEVEATRKIGKLVLTENLAWTFTTSGSKNRAFLTDWEGALGNSLPLCTHYEGVGGGGSYPSEGICIINANGTPIFNADFVSDKTEWLAYLQQQYAAGTPVTLWYVLTNETTRTVNEPLMKIGDYADTLSNAASIPTTEGANSITVDTTVQPSEFTATWTGWHNAEVKEKSENLFDKAQTSLIYGAYLTSDGTWLWDGSSRTVKLLCDGNTQYTISIGVTSPIFRISEYNDSTVTPSSSASSSAILNSIVRGENMDEYTFTTAADTKCLIFQASYAIYDSWINSLMFNEGQTALPYEPYWK